MQTLSADQRNHGSRLSGEFIFVMLPLSYFLNITKLNSHESMDPRVTAHLHYLQCLYTLV